MINHPGDFNGPKVKTFGKGRPCIGCDRELSEFNSEPICGSCVQGEKKMRTVEGISSTEAAELLGVDMKRVGKLGKQGKIGIVKHGRRGKGGATIFVREDVERLARLTRVDVDVKNLRTELPIHPNDATDGVVPDECCSRLDPCPGPDVCQTVDVDPAEDDPVGHALPFHLDFAGYNLFDAETQAIGSAYSALKDLDEHARARAIIYLSDRLDLDL